MNRFLPVFNLVGIVALTVLCMVQWWTNRQLHLEVFNQERTILEHVSKLAAQDRTIKNSAADLDAFREQLVRSDAALKEAEAKLAVHPVGDSPNAAERDQLKKNIDVWTAAIATRDGQLKIVNERLQSLARERNEAADKFNELAGKYNSVVKDLNDARARLASAKSGGTSSAR